MKIIKFCPSLLSTILLIPFLFLYCSCSTVPENPKTNPRKSPDSCSYRLRENARICDTCWSTLLVHHDECTECKDVYVDSGTVYLSHQILSEFDSLIRTRHPSPDEIPPLTPLINTVDLYFEHPGDYNRLWKFPDEGDLYKHYRITGRVTGWKFPSSLQFQMKRYTLLGRSDDKRSSYSK